MTPGSPALLVSQSPPSPDHSVLFAAGPKREFPDLSKTWKCTLSIVTTLFGPTAPLGSGGAHPPQRLLAPSKLMMGEGIPILPSTRWTTGSRTTRPAGLSGIGPCSSFSRSSIGFAETGLMLRNGGEISNFTTGITPRYCARISGCELWAGGLG